MTSSQRLPYTTTLLQAIKPLEINFGDQAFELPSQVLDLVAVGQVQVQHIL